MTTTDRAGIVVKDEAPRDPAPPSLRLEHVPLRVADLERAIAFYRDVLGLT